MGGGGDLQPVNGLQRDVEGGVHADGDVGAVQIVVNGGGHAHHGESAPRQLVGPGLGAVAADDHQPGDAAGPQLPDRLEHSGPGPELRTAGAAQEGAALLNDAAHVPGAQGDELPLDQARVPVADAVRLPAAVNGRAHRSPDGRVHARGVTAAGKDRQPPGRAQRGKDPPLHGDFLRRRSRDSRMMRSADSSPSHPSTPVFFFSNSL